MYKHLFISKRKPFLIALLIVFTIPIIGVLIGLTYKQNRLKNETYRERMGRCGDFPYEDGVPTGGGGFVRIDNVKWSVNCKYITWSVKNTGTVVITGEDSGEGVKGDAEEGTFIYSTKTKKINRLPEPAGVINSAVIDNWTNSDLIDVVYTKSNKNYRFIYDAVTNQISPK